jgi:hypothetical protein
MCTSRSLLSRTFVLQHDTTIASSPRPLSMPDFRLKRRSGTGTISDETSRCSSLYGLR